MHWGFWITTFLTGFGLLAESRLRTVEYVPDAVVWRTPPIRPQGFQFEVQISSLGTSYELQRVKDSIRFHDLGEFESALSPVMAAEWGYSFTHLDGQVDGAGRRIRAGYPNPPVDRAECLRVIEAFLHRQYVRGAAHPWSSMNGHFPWHHYAAEMGFDQIGSEIGENINGYQWHIALTRGAARQFRRPWFIDFSAWHGPSITDYSPGRIWGEHSGPDHGHSMSLFERTLFLAYMSGAGQITAEAGGAIAFLTDLDAAGHYRLSPYGEVCQRLARFRQAHPDVGIPCTPFAVVLDHDHGAYPGFGKQRAFWHFDYTAGDAMTWNLVDRIWPGSWEVMGRNEAGCLVNGPWGDTFDILLQNAPQEVLNSYPCLLLSGDVRLSQAEAQRFRTYVLQGGTLVLNASLLGNFPEYDVGSDSHSRRDWTLGRGHVRVLGSDPSWEDLDSILLSELSRRLPVRVSPGVEWLVNLRDDVVWVTLINNDGVTKAPREKAVVDASKHRTATVTYTGPGTLSSAEDIRNGRPSPIAPGGKLVVPIPPGDMVILELHIAPVP